MPILPIQCRMARVALGLGVRDLAALAEVSPNTIARLERGETLYEQTLETVARALETAGVEFIAENGGGPGVRLKKGQKRPRTSSKRTKGSRTGR
jgi:transcriptional regulator with XRE-family HTH domain